MSESYLFEDLKVLDVGTWIAAPVAATMLADFGAQVIKVEMPGTGDAYRIFPDTAGAPDSKHNYTWQMDARNKRSLTLNLKSERGREILRQLVAQCDVYITNQPKSMREAWGLTYEALQPLNPRMIYASLTAYGEQGPDRDREAFDLVAYWSRSGLMDLVRHPGDNPAPALPGMGDHPSAVTLYAAIVTALLKRERTGVGSHVHTSLLANGLWSASCVAQGAFVDAEFEHYRERLALLYTRVMYETADGRWLQFTMVRTEEEQDLMFTVLGMPEVLIDERFATLPSRVAHGAELVAMMRPVIAQQDAATWLSAFAQAGVPAALVAQVEELPQDPQVKENEMVLDANALGMQQVIKHPVNVDGLTRAPLQAAPAVGEHSREILSELGLSQADIDQLVQDDVI